MSRAGLAGHAAALLTIFLWGTTFISTKVLLTGLRPVEVLFLRFALGFVALCLLYPRRLRLAGRRQERQFCVCCWPAFCRGGRPGRRRPDRTQWRWQRWQALGRR